MSYPYTVSLIDAHGLPTVQRIEAEKRFARAIEKAIGSAEEVAQTLRAWQAASESDATELDQETANLATRWPRAADKAQQAGFRDLGEFPGAHFDVRLSKATA